MTNSIDEVSDADLILVIGSNTTEQHPLVGTRIFEALEKGAQLYVVDPRKIRLTDFAHAYAPIEPGTNLAFINAMIQVIIEEDLVDQHFIETRTENYEAVKASVAHCTPEWAAPITRLSAETIRQFARTYAKTDKAMILFTMGVTQQTTGVKSIRALANLAMMTNHVGRPSTGINPLRGQNNVQGAGDMAALPNYLPGYQWPEWPETKERFSKVWGDFSCLRGNNIIQMFDLMDEGIMKAMYIVGENPVLSDPDQTHTIHALEKIPFLVVQDIFLTETARYADVVLPAASFLERDGTYTNTERRVQLIRKVIEPVGDCKPDWVIINEIMKRIGMTVDYESPAQVMDEINLLVDSYGGITHERIQEVGLQWPCPTKDHPGTPILHVGEFKRGKGLFTVNDWELIGDQRSEAFPFILTTGRVTHHYHTGTMTRKIWTLDREYPKGFVEIHPKDAADLGIREHQEVRITSARGTITAPAMITDRINEKTVFIPFHFAEIPVNRLTGRNLDPIINIPALKVSAVRIEVAS
ncbi:formate dehydrogenase major subunit/formate dehydrogenase alpha subunit [Anoxynatronum buryatiense]|uniref:Formate dehydrogenase major subunit/formate dehydrogenase alpha subunit n=3 Tax=Anoxynatronum buryatiense TaxID=489973 RepID=A0AA45WT69_9CLOT|nr:formate dehydrogenase major subunit/formate dehydrogenase alpha subunit [Anoxynatronum buryatiense]